MTSEQTETSLREVLTQLSIELAHAVEWLVKIEDAVIEVADRADIFDPTSTQNIQHIDKVKQSLEALSDYAADVAGKLPQSYVIDCREALARIKIGALAEKLRAGSSAPPASQSITDGEPDFFDDQA